jgi:hypothetical protein
MEKTKAAECAALQSGFAAKKRAPGATRKFKVFWNLSQSRLAFYPVQEKRATFVALLGLAGEDNPPLQTGDVTSSLQDAWPAENWQAVRLRSRQADWLTDGCDQ